MKKIFIHIGTPKTGSTAIQQFLFNNENILLQKNYKLLRFPEFLSVLENIEDLNSINKSLIEKARMYFTKQINKEVGVLSWEGFSGNAYIGLKNSKIVAYYLSKIFVDFDITIIVFLRRQDDFIESLYTEYIKGGNFVDFQEFAKPFFNSSYLNYYDLLESYFKYFKKIIVKKYHKKYLPTPKSLIENFINIIGINLNINEYYIPEANKGLSIKALILMKLVNPYLNRKEKLLLAETLQSISTKNMFENYSYWENVEKRLNFLKIHETSNKLVAKKYFDEDVELFPTYDIKNYNYELNFGSKLDMEDFFIIVIKALLQNQLSPIQKKILSFFEEFYIKISIFINKFPRLKYILKKIVTL